MSEKDPIVKYSWEDIKFTIGFEDKNGSPIDAETKKFKFIYKDESGCCCEVSYDGKTRKNCVFRDGVLSRHIQFRDFPLWLAIGREALLDRGCRFR
jgi:hypothetical protein